MHGDLLCNTLSFILRVLGKEDFVLMGFLISYYGVGLTCSLTFGVWFGLGYPGVWTSLVIGFYLMLAVCAFKLKQIDWNKEVSRIAAAHKRHSEIEMM